MGEALKKEELSKLARLYGVALNYFDCEGRFIRVSNETVLALLRSMGVDPERSFSEHIEELRLKRLKAALPPLSVVPQHISKVAIFINLLESDLNRKLTWILTFEDGESINGSFVPKKTEALQKRTIRGTVFYRFKLILHGEFPLGYHSLKFNGVDSLIIVAPERCYLPESLKTNKRSGISLQVYSLQSERNWGVGDFTDLITLASELSGSGLSFIGVSPLHATSLFEPGQYSPYSPSSRIWLNALFLDPTLVPGFCEDDLSDDLQEKLYVARESRFVDYQQALKLKLKVLDRAFVRFCKDKNTTDRNAFSAFCEKQGHALEDYCCYEALGEYLKGRDGKFWGWPVWPAEYRDPRSEVVRDFSESHRDRIDFVKFLQWQAFLQLEKVCSSLKKHSYDLALYTDLALGGDRSGADVWQNQKLYALEASVGAPPDPYNLKGQNWGFPPVVPQRLRDEGYSSLIQVLRTNMRYASMIRIDHIMAFTRLYWIPKDMPPQSGTYVKYSMHELLSIVALESVRNECVVVGEDLGTVPEQFRIKLNQRAVLSYKVFLFMKEHDGSFVSSDKYPDNVLVTATTHDLPTLRGYWNGDDLRIKQDLNLFESASQDEVFRIQRDRDRKEIIELLYSSDLLSSKEVPETFNKELFLAVHKFLNDTPAKLFVITLEDIAGQSEQVNIPGIVDDYPSWRVKTPVSIEKIGDLATFQSLVSHVLPLQRA